MRERGERDYQLRSRAMLELRGGLPRGASGAERDRARPNRDRVRGSSPLHRLILYYGLAVGVFSLLGASTARSQGSFTAQRVASGLTQPLFVTAPPGDVNH